MKRKLSIISVLVALVMLLGSVPFSAFAALGSGDESGKLDQPDAMQAIEADEELAAFKQGSTQAFADDGYIGIPYEVSVYYDKDTHGAANPAYNGTVAIMYVVNSAAERTGTDSDVEIILSMLERGYVVVVLDYLNNAKAVSPDLEWGVQVLREKMKTGDYFEDKTVFPKGDYCENHVVPAGHNIRVADIFFEIDKHGEDGVLEKIVETWNYDFRSCRASTVIRWVDENGNRKATQKGWDGSDPVWYADAAGQTVDNENGEYIKINHTWAKKIEDCVKKDGTPIDLNLYIHTIYPTNPVNEVPVMVLSGSAEHLAGVTAKLDRPHNVGFSFNGYAVAAFDHEYVPMARDDHYGYFAGDQSSGVTGINNSFTVGRYTSASFNTAALRYLRYLSYTVDDIKFDDDAIGVYGNSKGGNQTFLGMAVLRESKSLSELGAGATKADLEAYIDNKITNSFRDRYIVVMDPECQVTDKNGKAETYYDYDGDSRYQNGVTEDIVFGDYVIDGGELQPWLTYTDENGELREILSGANLIYSSCSGTPWNDWTDFSPAFTTSNFGDSWGGGYNTHNYLPNLFRIYDIPSLYFELPIQHNVVQGKDIKYGIDTYTAFFKFCHYFLRNDPVSVAYAEPIHGESEVNTTDEIRIKFLGSVSAEEIEKVIVCDENGNVATGSWFSECGNTEWHFVPKALNGGVKYTVTVPSDLKGENGKETGDEYSFSFYTKGESSVAFDMNSPVTVTDSEGTHFSFTVPAEIEAPANRLVLRFKVSNDAANTAKIYEASSLSDTSGKLIGSINLKGSDYYEYDVSDYVMSKTAGEKVYFFVKAEKAASDTVTYVHEFDSKTNIGSISWSSETQLVTEVAGESVTALEQKITYGSATNSYGVIQGYSSWYPTALTVNKVINNGSPVTEADYGRTFTFTLRIYDTASRSIQLWFNDCISTAEERVDYSYTRLSVTTVANEWMELTLPYTVYEMDYGVTSQVKQLIVKLWSDGSKQSPIYYDSLTVTEHITDVEISEASLVSKTVGGGEYKAPESTEKHFEVNGVQYALWSEAISATGSTVTDVKLLSDYTFKSSDSIIISARDNLVIDLNGYTATLDNKSLLVFGSVRTNTVAVTVKNGNIVVDGAPIISYASASADGDGKKYNVSFENVDIVVADGATATEVISAETSPAGASVTQNVKFTDCTVNVNRKALPKFTPCAVFPEGEGTLTSAYEFVGGEIFVSSLVRLELTGSTKALNFKPDGNGDYTALKVCESVSISKDMTVLSESGYSYFVLDSTANGYKSYKITTPKYTTPYGIIPDDMTPEEYPFALFSDGEFLGAYAIWSQSDAESALWAARKQMAKPSQSNVEVQLVLRRDYATNSADHEYRNLAHFFGTLVIDLGTNTLTSADAPLFVAKAQTVGDMYNEQVRITVKNGHLAGGATQMLQTYTSVATNRMDTYTAAQLFDFNFIDVDFDIPAGANNIVSTVNSTNHDKGLGTVCNVTFTDCDFNFASGFNGGVFSGVHSKDTNNVNILNVRINGGSITSADISQVSFFEGGANDSMVYGANESGAYTTLTMPASVSLSTFGGINDKGEFVEFGDGVADGDNTVYTLKASTNITKYGAIPSEYADTTAYPLAVFSNGQFMGAFSLLMDNSGNKGDAGIVYNGQNGVNSAFEMARAITIGGSGIDVQILFRDDVTNTLWGYNNFAHIDGHLTIDLDGHTFTNNSSAGVFAIGAKQIYKNGANSCPDTNYSMINGTVITSGPLLRFNTVVSATYDSLNDYKHVNLNFEGLDIKFTGTKYNGFIALCYTDLSVDANGNYKQHNVNKGSFFNVTVTDCTLDITSVTNATTKIAVGKDTVPDANLNNLCVEINGGKIITNKNTTLSLGDYNEFEGNNGDSITFGKGKDGKYTEIETNSSAVPGFAVPTTDNGVSVWGRYSLSSGVYVYALGETTEYGVIPYLYDSETYPFAVFRDGVLVGAYKIWAKDNDPSALSAARNEMAGSRYSSVNVQILLRRDYTTTTANDGWYNNLAHFGGTTVIDLGEHTFSLTQGRAFLRVKAQTTGDDFVPTSYFIIKGGTIVTDGSEAVLACSTEVIASKIDKYISKKCFDIRFEGTKFNITDTGIAKMKISNHEYGGEFIVTLDGCTLNISSSFNGILFDGVGTDTTDTNDLILKINGGTVNASAFDVTRFINLGTGDSLVFQKLNSAYTTLTLPKGVNAPDASFATEDGSNYAFLKVGENGNNVIYTLKDNTFRIVSAFLNLDSDINVIYRAFVPTGYANPYMVFEFNGKTYTAEEFFIDENGLYCFVFEGIAPHMMGDNIKATLYANGGAVSVEKATYSIKEYCEYQLANSNDTKVKTLVSDLLVYGEKAQLYMGYKTDALVTDGVELSASEFEALDESKYKVSLSGEASELVSFSGVGLYLDNDINLKLTFKAQSAEGLTVVITVGDKAPVELGEDAWYSDGKGNYRIYFDGIMATEFDETVTVSFKLNGEAVGQTLTYSVNSYVYYMQDNANELLSELVKAIYNYGRSAVAYGN